MALEEHPLDGNSDWVFHKPGLSVKIKYATVHIGSKDATKVSEHTLTGAYQCREVLIGDTRQAFKRLTTTLEAPPDGPHWNKILKQVKRVVLDHESVLGPEDCLLSISSVTSAPAEEVKQFLKVADIVAGIPLALLNPKTRSKDWWDKLLDNRSQFTRFAWLGTDNGILQHPAFFSIATGLIRQAFLLHRCGFGEEILESGNHEEVLEAIISNDTKALLKQAEVFRPWINVPIASRSEGLVNFPFPWVKPQAKKVSYWQRFIRLERAIRKHGLNAVIGEDFTQGWDLLGKNICYSGAYSFWGAGSNLTESHKRIMKLGQPKKKSNETEATS